MLDKVISGGQTGVDQAALDAAAEAGLACGGWCPKDRWSEAGPIDLRYPLTETPSADPAQRTVVGHHRGCSGSPPLLWPLWSPRSRTTVSTSRCNGIGLTRYASTPRDSA